VGSKCSQCRECSRSIHCLTCSDLLSSRCALGSHLPDLNKDGSLSEEEMATNLKDRAAWMAYAAATAVVHEADDNKVYRYMHR
jgi:hypothetical protein